MIKLERVIVCTKSVRVNLTPKSSQNGGAHLRGVPQDVNNPDGGHAMTTTTERFTASR